MANTGVSHGEVKSICDNLECSPSSHSPGSSLYSGSDDNPTAHQKSPKHSASSGEEEASMGAKRVPAVHLAAAKNKTIKKAT